jgi:hypothetical protein
MKKTIITLLAFLSMATTAVASDSIAAGVRIGSASATNRDSTYYEVFGDLYLNGLVSIGATAAYVSADHNNFSSFRRDESYPITALFKVHAPIPFIHPYAGLGEAIILHNKKSLNCSPVALAGVNISPLPIPLFLNLEYRRQFNGEMDFIAGGVGVKF